MSFDTELDENRNRIVNIVFAIDIPDNGTVYFSKRPVQSGLTVDSDKQRLISTFSVKGTQIDLKRARQSIANATIKLIDKDEVFSSFLGLSVAALANFDCRVFVGLITVDGFDFSDYVKIGDYRIGDVKTGDTIYTIELNTPESALNKPIYRFEGNLTSSITDIQTTIDVDTSSDFFPSSGRAKINDEFIIYSGKTFLTNVTTLTGVTRGTLSSDADDHTVGSSVFVVEEVVDNPIDILLQIITSTGSGTNGAFDVLLDGLGLDEDRVDITSFTDIRDTFFQSDEFTLYLYDIADGLKYLEVELLQANNLRLINSDGKVGISILDQSDPNVALDVVGKDTIINKKKPTWKMTQKKIVNEVKLQYGFIEGTQQYSRTVEKDDQDSKDKYGVERGETIRIKGIFSDAIATDRANRYLARFSTPEVTIKTTEDLQEYNRRLGSKVNLRVDELPGLGGGRGLDAEVEYLRQAMDFSTGVVNKTYIFTSYTNLRRGRVAPTSIVTEILNPQQFRIDTPDSWLPEYKVRLFNSTTKEFVTGVDEILTIVDDLITLKDGTLSLQVGLKLVFPIYDDQSSAQRARYMSIVGPTGLFANGDGGFRIF